ncbi:uncharacterized protein YecE (DUF72 family) [Granulicella aggregans]|uniref:Uncharacterized protein YecE (DUF72 family) n=2 Tax=Granulicella aggregans TaxID=474949 RepID=A0A7W7ZHT8_9BACT|nr:uncharacterized protein YecE (DUF72 family) [Granulicella aggregans]
MSEAPQRGRIHIGISGWRYAAWRGKFYPEGLAQRRELEFAAKTFSSVEINGTFYSLQRPSSFEQWSSETPEGFVFAVKGGRFITHMKKLTGVETALANFFASGVLALGPKIGPFLWQLPPMMKFNQGPYETARYESFFTQLPRTVRSAARLARQCDERMLSRAYMKPVLKKGDNPPMRHAIEVRHESFVQPAFVDLLRKHDVGLVVADTVEWPLLMDVTSDFVYVRLHGSEQLYFSGYEPDAIEVWARRVVAFATGEAAEGRYAGTAVADGMPRDVYVYFDNDAKVRAPVDAQALQRRVNELLQLP